METQSYYLSPESLNGGPEECSLPLRVNCAGYVAVNTPFSTSGKRSDWYLQIMDSGCLMDRTGEVQPFSSGQFILRSPLTNYRYELAEAQEMSYYWIHFSGSDIPRLLSECRLLPNRIYPLSEGLPSSVRLNFDSLFREFMFRQPGFIDLSAALMTSILVRLGRAASKENPESLRSRLKTSTEYIHQHYSEELKVCDLARMEHLSESRFRELFREAFGTSPNDYIIQQGCSMRQIFWRSAI